MRNSRLHRFDSRYSVLEAAPAVNEGGTTRDYARPDFCVFKRGIRASFLI